MAVAAIVSGVFLVALVAKERDNRFCVSCHLHDEKFTRLVASVSTDLAGLHFRKDGNVGCIACHAGAGPRRRIAVWSLAALDTLRFIAGVYEEPTHMRISIPDSECRTCHTPILRGAPAAAGTEAAYAAEAESEGRDGGSYHAIREHETVRVQCVRCHTTHTADSTAANRFISRERIVPACRECHKEM